MTKNKDFANTPCYVLKSGNQPIYPTINFDDPKTNCVCVYGFSDKPIYDRFIKSTEQLLTPYPLVKGFLANQIAELDSAESKGTNLSMVILDATDLAQPVLFASTMAAVLLAQRDNLKQVPVEIELIFDPETISYQFTPEPEATPEVDIPYIVT